MKKPITQKAKSPLKQTRSSGESITMESTSQSSTPGTPGTTSTSVERTPRKLKSYREAYKNVDKSKYPTYESFVKAAEDWWEKNPDKKYEEKVTTIETPGTPGETTTTTEKMTPQMRETYTGITPWENRFNMRTARQSERFARNEAKRDLRRQANEDARRARRQGGMSYAESLKLRRGIMKGDEEKYSDLYNASRGTTEKAQRIYDTEMQQNQFNQGSTRGEKVKGEFYDVSVGQAGEAGGQQVIKNLQGLDPGLETNLNKEVVSTTTETTDPPKSAAEMRYDQNIGIKDRTPMKKGYFKGK